MNSENNMVSETVQVSCVTNGGIKNNESIKRKHLGTDEHASASCHDSSDAKGDIGASDGDMAANINEDTQADDASVSSTL